MSIYNKIRIIFLVAALFTTAFFGSFFYIQKNDHVKQIQKRYIQTAFYISRHLKQNKNKDLRQNLQDPNLKLFLKESDFSIVKNRQRVSDVLKYGHTVLKRKVMRSTIKIIGERGVMHLYIKNRLFRILLKDKQAVSFPWSTLFWYLSALALLVLLYLWLTKSLKPLKTLQSQIHKVADGDLSISVKSNKRDEIAQVANAFDDALRKLESLINSRQLFLRSIMHELKTPLAKGKLLNEFLENPTQKEGYDAIFERLELLIEEFSKIEQMLSSSYEAKLANYSAVDIVEQALELMILDESEMEQKVTLVPKSDYRLHTDFELLALALKNLIDNAIKYGAERKVVIQIDAQGILISNNGTQFTHSLEPYLEPFHDQKHGLGLGLYIVQNITKMLSLNLTYHYSEGQNHFRISQCSI